MNVAPVKLSGLILAGVILAVLSGVTGFWLARRGETGAGIPAQPANVPGQERKPLYWYDPMQPNQHFDKPGKSPFMDMQLIPMYADEAPEGGAGSIRIDPDTVQNLGVRTTEVERGVLSMSLDAVGTLGFNQRDIAVIQARANGFVAKVYARAPGDVIGRDAQIVDLLVPEWAGAQTEFLALLKSGDRDLIDAARQRLLLLGMPPELIRQVEATRELHTMLVQNDAPPAVSNWRVLSM